MGATADEDLLQRIAGGDETALRVLYARHHQRLFRFALRLVADPGLAEDAMSEVFIDVWQQAGRFEGRSSVTTWLLTLARNKAFSALRKRREASWDDDAASDLPDDGDTPEIALAKDDKAAALRACLGKLGPDHREVLDLAYFHERSILEIAEIVGVPEATVKTRMFYARKKLADIAREAGLDRGWP